MIWAGMGDYKDPDGDADVQVTMHPHSDDAGEEWDNDFVESGDAATVIDPDALKKLRLDESALLAPHSLESSVTAPAKSGTSRFEKLSEVVDEFDDQDMTVMDPRSLADREVSTESQTPAHEPCPKCGVMLAPGYPKCPRCKAVLIKASATRDQAKGGTSVIGRTVPWTIVFIAAILTAIIYYLAERDPATDSDTGANAGSQEATPDELQKPPSQDPEGTNEEAMDEALHDEL